MLVDTLNVCLSEKYMSLLHQNLLCFLCSFIFQDDKTRVAVGDNQDYINASYICMQVGDEEYFYISCQGPLPSTVTAFWQMIWENKSDVIAMMTQEVERGRIKCHKYWPERLGTSQDAGGYQLHLENQQFLENFHIKVIRMVEKQVRDQETRRPWEAVWAHAALPSSQATLTWSITWSSRTGPTTACLTAPTSWCASSATWGRCTARAPSRCTVAPGSAARASSSAPTSSSASSTTICLWVQRQIGIRYDSVPSRRQRPPGAVFHLNVSRLQIDVSDIVKEMRLQRHGMIQTKVSASRGGGKVQSSQCKNSGSQKLDVAFVCLVSGTVSLLLQCLVGGFTGNFTASRQPMATGKSPNPKVAERLRLSDCWYLFFFFFFL